MRHLIIKILLLLGMLLLAACQEIPQARPKPQIALPKGVGVICVDWQAPSEFKLDPMVRVSKEYWASKGLTVLGAPCQEGLPFTITVKYLNHSSQRLADEIQARGFGGSVLAQGTVVYHWQSFGKEVPVRLDAALGNAIGALEDTLKRDKVYALVSDIETRSALGQLLRFRLVTTIPALGTLGQAKEALAQEQAQALFALLSARHRNGLLNFHH